MLTEWSRHITQTANWNGFEVVSKRVKYIHNPDNAYGFEKKCDLDVEMAIDMIQEHEKYDTIVLFSGDGDLMRAMKYLHVKHKKNAIVIGVRNHIGREIFDSKNEGIISTILFADDFEYRLNLDRHKKR